MTFNQTKKLFLVSLTGTSVIFWFPFIDNMTGVATYIEIVPRIISSGSSKYLTLNNRHFWEQVFLE
jgi:hypothetical protein